MRYKLCKFCENRARDTPLRGEKPQNRPLSKLNTGRFALLAMLPVKTLLSFIEHAYVAAWHSCAAEWVSEPSISQLGAAEGAVVVGSFQRSLHSERWLCVEAHDETTRKEWCDASAVLCTFIVQFFCIIMSCFSLNVAGLCGLQCRKNRASVSRLAVIKGDEKYY